MALTSNKLSPAMWRVLGELAEPNQNASGEWYFPRKNLRTLVRLRDLGLATFIDSTQQRYGYAITVAGRERLTRRQAGLSDV